ncbi:MAG: sugar-binding transcriptional regulator [Epulopiscium sp.]|mgnify:CR=1 FL=1|nr:sugar-binding transcriptional regulator [Candidatus Epulonipiscium sp.]
MKTIFAALQKIIPEGMESLQRRYHILRGIYYLQPIGRRTLASELQLTERAVRTDTEFLKQYQFIQVSSTGMTITEAGITLLYSLQEFMHQLKGFFHMEEQINHLLGSAKVVIVPGDADEDPIVKKDLGKVAAQLFKEKLHSNSIIAVTGGSTVAEVVGAMPTVHGYKDILVVPARGSLGHQVEYQSNTLASQLANKIGASYQLLNIPDNLSKRTLETVKHEPLIQYTLQKILQADMLLFGIGNALTMAERRNLSETVIDYLERKQAVAEAFGYYFDEKGKMVYTSQSVGIKLEQIKGIPFTLAVAGGASKAKAIHALAQVLENVHLVIDEGVARELLRYREANPL